MEYAFFFVLFTYDYCELNVFMYMLGFHQRIANDFAQGSRQPYRTRNLQCSQAVSNVTIFAWEF